MPRVSVVITVYNKPRWLRQCLDSVLAQTYGDYEALVMEDNSPDPLVGQILDDYEDYPQFNIYRSGVTNSARAKTTRYATLINTAVREFSSGDLITYLTDDDFYYPDRLQRMVDYIDAHTIDVVYGAQDLCDAEGNIVAHRGQWGQLKRGAYIIDHNSVMNTRKAYDAAGGWDDHPKHWSAADAAFWLRLEDKGFPFFSVGVKPTDCKRIHPDSIQSRISRGEMPY